MPRVPVHTVDDAPAESRDTHVDDTTWKTAVDAGWSEHQILEAYADVVRTIMTNYFNHLVGTEVDLPEAPPLG